MSAPPLVQPIQRNNHGSDVTALEEEEGDYDSDSHDNFYKAVAQHAEYKPLGGAIQLSPRYYFGTYTPLHSMSPLHEQSTKRCKHSRNWKRRKKIFNTREGASCGCSP